MFALRRLVLVTIVVASNLIIKPVRAEDAPPPRTITVTGTAEVRIVPDQVKIRLAVSTFAKDLAEAKKANDDRTKAVLAVIETFKIESKHVQTGSAGITPRYQYDSGVGFRYDNLLGYMVSKDIAITLSDVSKLEAVLSAVLEAGANGLDGVDFETTRLSEHRAEARKAALRAARLKADEMAAVLEEKVGRPRQIVEEAPGLRGGHWANSVSFEEAPDDGSSAGSGETFALGQITVQSRVIVVFELQ